MRAVAVLCTIALALVAMAQDDVEGTLYWERVDAEIVVTPEGNLDITEVPTCRSSASSSTATFRWPSRDVSTPAAASPTWAATS